MRAAVTRPPNPGTLTSSAAAWLAPCPFTWKSACGRPGYMDSAGAGRAVRDACGEALARRTGQCQERVRGGDYVHTTAQMLEGHRYPCTEGESALVTLRYETGYREYRLGGRSTHWIRPYTMCPPGSLTRYASR